MAAAEEAHKELKELHGAGCHLILPAHRASDADAPGSGRPLWGPHSGPKAVCDMPLASRPQATPNTPLACLVTPGGPGTAAGAVSVRRCRLPARRSRALDWGTRRGAWPLLNSLTMGSSSCMPPNVT